MENGCYQILRGNILCTLDDPPVKWIFSLPSALFDGKRGVLRPCSSLPTQ